MSDEAVPGASRRAGIWVFLGIALVLAAAAAPAAAAIPPVWGAKVTAALPGPPAIAAPVVAHQGPPPGAPEDRLAPEDAALPAGPGNAGGAPWRPSMDAVPGRAPVEGPGAVARLAGSRSPLLPGAPLEGVLHGLAPPDPRPLA